MDPKILFWTWALANMGLIVAFAFVGVSARRAGDLAGHRRMMMLAAALVGVFLAAYVLKLAFLGREDMSVWSTYAVWTLRFHESCVAVMLIAGGIAMHRGRKLSATRNVTHDPADPPAEPTLSGGHRRLGRAAVIAAVLGVFSAAVVLFDMYQRAGIL